MADGCRRAQRACARRLNPLWVALVVAAACERAPVDKPPVTAPIVAATQIKPAPLAAPVGSAPQPSAPLPQPSAPEDEFDALAQKIVEAKTHAAYSPVAHTAAFLYCIHEEGSGSSCSLMSQDVHVRERDYAEGIALWEIGQDDRAVSPQALAKVAAELRAKKYVGLPRVDWADGSKPLDVPGIGAFAVKGDTLRSPRPKPLLPLETALERQVAPHRNRPTAVFASPGVPVALVEITRDPGTKYGEGFNESTYVRIAAVGPSAAEPARKPLATIAHGGTYFGVYLALARPGDASLKRVFEEAKRKGLSPSMGDLACDGVSAEELGYKEPIHGVGVYFATEEAARRFAGQLRPKPVGLARVSAGCGD